MDNEEVLAKLEKLKVVEPSKLIDGEMYVLSYSFNQPATQPEIEALEVSLGQKLPDEFRSFLLHYDGCTLFKLSNIAGFKFLSTSEILATQLEQAEIYQEEWPSNIIVFCELIGEGNYFGFRLQPGGGYEILDCFHEELPSEWKALDLTFMGLIGAMIHANETNMEENFWLYHYKS
jgi:hypothetical protein